MRERELKLALPGRFALPRLVLDGEPVHADPLPELDLRATYHDTSDLRLARHGVTLRHRIGEPGGPRWTLKLPASAVDNSEREELHFDGARRDAPAEARRLVTAWVRGSELGPVATLRTRRHRWRLRLGEQELAELDDDEVSVLEGRRVVSRFRELELEARQPDAPLLALAEQLNAAGAAPAEPIPKVVRALGSRATAAPDVSVAAVPEDAPMRDAVAAAIADAAVRMIDHDALARLGDPEGIHQLRVACRRLRSDLRTFGPHIEPGWMSRIVGSLREIATRLGAARDLDVLTARLVEEMEGLTPTLQPLLDQLGARRAQAQERLMAGLEQASYVGLLDDLVAAASRPQVTEEAQEAAGDAAPPLAMAAWRKLARRAEAIEAQSPNTAFHRVRISTKRARYAAEAAARTLPDKRAKAARRFADRLAELQDLLGGLQDATLAAAEVEAAVAARPRDAVFALAAGRLLERQLRRVAEARDAFPKLYADVRRARWRRWAEA